MIPAKGLSRHKITIPSKKKLRYIKWKRKNLRITVGEALKRNRILVALPFCSCSQEPQVLLSPIFFWGLLLVSSPSPPLMLIYRKFIIYHFMYSLTLTSTHSSFLYKVMQLQFFFKFINLMYFCICLDVSEILLILFFPSYRLQVECDYEIVTIVYSVFFSFA